MSRKSASRKSTTISFDELAVEIINLGQGKQFEELQELISNTDGKLVSITASNIPLDETFHISHNWTI